MQVHGTRKEGEAKKKGKKRSVRGDNVLKNGQKTVDMTARENVTAWSDTIPQRLACSQVFHTHSY